MIKDIRRKKIKEYYGTAMKGPNGPQVFIALGFWLVGFFVAIWLSWSCNSYHNYSAMYKILFAFFAGLQSWGYLSVYLFYKYGLCGV